MFAAHLVLNSQRREASDLSVTAAENRVPISSGESAESECVGRNDSCYIHKDI